jgi:hypothetical protein
MSIVKKEKKKKKFEENDLKTYNLSEAGIFMLNGRMYVPGGRTAWPSSWLRGTPLEACVAYSASAFQVSRPWLRSVTKSTTTR